MPFYCLNQIIRPDHKLFHHHFLQSFFCGSGTSNLMQINVFNSFVGDFSVPTYYTRHNVSHSYSKE